MHKFTVYSSNAYNYTQKYDYVNYFPSIIHEIFKNVLPQPAPASADGDKPCAKLGENAWTAACNYTEELKSIYKQRKSCYNDHAKRT